MMINKPSLLFMGSPQFACDILQALHAAGYLIVGVVAQPDKQAGRGMKMHSPEVAVFARQNNLPLLQPDKLNTPDVQTRLIASLRKPPDFVVVAAYGKLLPEAVLTIPKIDCLNVHASLLPEYRGAAPINYALLDGKTETGVGIMRMVKELDAGPVYASEGVKIDTTDTAITLTKKLSTVGAELLMRTMGDIILKGSKPIDQDHAKATYAPKLTRELSPIDWTQPAEKIFNQIRALIPWPVASTMIPVETSGRTSLRLKIFSATILPEKSTQPPGTIVHVAKTGWTVATRTTHLLVTEVQLEGKNKMSAFDLANGLRLNAGVVLKI